VFGSNGTCLETHHCYDGCPCLVPAGSDWARWQGPTGAKKTAKNEEGHRIEMVLGVGAVTHNLSLLLLLLSPR